MQKLDTVMFEDQHVQVLFLAWLAWRLPVEFQRQVVETIPLFAWTIGVPSRV